jgi:hypothetical protein
VEEVGEAEEGEKGAEGEEGVGLSDAGDVEEAEGGEEDDGGEPGGEASVGSRQPGVEEGDEGDGGERGAEAGGELGDAEELEEEGGDPVGEGRLVDPDEGVPVGDEPSCEIKLPGQHLAGDLGVDAFVPVGEAVVAEEGEEDEGGEERGERGGDDGLAAGVREGLGFVRRVTFRGHENNIRDGGWEGRGVGTIDLASETFVRIAGRGAGQGGVSSAVGDLLGGVCAAGGGDPGGAYVPDSGGAGEL